MVTGSNPVEPTFKANSTQNATEFYEKSHVLPEDLPLRDLLLILLGKKGRRHLELRQKTNTELLQLYDGELALRHRSSRGIKEAKRILGHFHEYIGEFPPSPEIAKAFLAQFTTRKPTTLARYTAILKMFFKWYGEDLDINIRVPKILPTYVDRKDIDKLLEAMRYKKTHKKNVQRDLLLVDLAIHTGLRRSELANLTIGDIDTEKGILVVRSGKGNKDRVIPLSSYMVDTLGSHIQDRPKNDSLFRLSAATISGKIRTFAKKAGVNIHAHSLRDYFATSLSERGATIREIQSLLGHANLAHTERYTLHTDKHLRQAIELMDKKPEEIRVEGIGKAVDHNGSEQKQAIIIIKCIEKSVNRENNGELINDYYSHFIARNEGSRSAVEVELALLDYERNVLDSYRETILEMGEELRFQPVLGRPNDRYYILCQYKQIVLCDSKEIISHTCLPFDLRKSSRKDEKYVISGELEFRFVIPSKDRVAIFPKKPD